MEAEVSVTDYPSETNRKKRSDWTWFDPFVKDQVELTGLGLPDGSSVGLLVGLALVGFGVGSLVGFFTGLCFVVCKESM